MKDLKKLGLWFIAMLLVTNVTLANAGQYLFYIDNDLSGEAWVDVSQGLTHNVSGSSWGLISSGAAPEYQDFAANYTETVGGSFLQQTATRSTWTLYDRTDETALLRENYITAAADFTCYFTLNVSYVEPNGGGTILIYPLVVASYPTLKDFRELTAINAEGYGIQVRADSYQDSWDIELVEGENGATHNTGVIAGLTEGQAYYVRFNKTSGSLGAAVYSDSGFSSKIADAVHTMQIDFDYTGVNDLYVPLGHDANTGPRDSSGYVEDLTFGAPGGGYGSPGYLYTGDLLVNTTMGPGFVFCSAQTVPAGSTLTVAFSEDNATWVRSTALNSVSGDLRSSIYLEDLNYTALYSRYTFTSEGTVTADLNEMSLAYVIDEPEGNGNGWIYALCASPVMLLLGIILKRPIPG